MQKIISRTIFGYELKGTENQLEQMYNLLNYEAYDCKQFNHYFHVWVKEGTGVWWFPKEKYYNGYEPYAIALLHYADSRLKDLVYESAYALYE
jgi:hypothetical protein